jgi:NAD(P)-dependent dehydrogenase (short-subunit alcohol dehydrogenase family)
MGGTGGRRVGHGLGIASAATAALAPFKAALALELAPVRVNLIAAGFLDTPVVGIAARRSTRGAPE